MGRTIPLPKKQVLPPGFLQELNCDLMEDFWYALAAARHPEAFDGSQATPCLHELFEKHLADVTWDDFWQAFPFELREQGDCLDEIDALGLLLASHISRSRFERHFEQLASCSSSSSSSSQQASVPVRISGVRDRSSSSRALARAFSGGPAPRQGAHAAALTRTDADDRDFFDMMLAASEQHASTAAARQGMPLTADVQQRTQRIPQRMRSRPTLPPPPLPGQRNVAYVSPAAPGRTTATTRSVHWRSGPRRPAAAQHASQQQQNAAPGGEAYADLFELLQQQLESPQPPDSPRYPYDPSVFEAARLDAYRASVPTYSTTIPAYSPTAPTYSPPLSPAHLPDAPNLFDDAPLDPAERYQFILPRDGMSFEEARMQATAATAAAAQRGSGTAGPGTSFPPLFTEATAAAAGGAAGGDGLQQAMNRGQPIRWHEDQGRFRELLRSSAAFVRAYDATAQRLDRVRQEQLESRVRQELEEPGAGRGSQQGPPEGDEVSPVPVGPFRALLSQWRGLASSQRAQQQGRGWWPRPPQLADPAAPPAAAAAGGPELPVAAQARLAPVPTAAAAVARPASAAAAPAAAAVAPRAGQRLTGQRRTRQEACDPEGFEQERQQQVQGAQLTQQLPAGDQPPAAGGGGAIADATGAETAMAGAEAHASGGSRGSRRQVDYSKVWRAVHDWLTGDDEDLLALVSQVVPCSLGSRSLKPGAETLAKLRVLAQRRAVPQKVVTAVADRLHQISPAGDGHLVRLSASSGFSKQAAAAAAVLECCERHGMLPFYISLAGLCTDADVESAVMRGLFGGSSPRSLRQRPQQQSADVLPVAALPAATAGTASVIRAAADVSEGPVSADLTLADMGAMVALMQSNEAVFNSPAAAAASRQRLLGMGYGQGLSSMRSASASPSSEDADQLAAHLTLLGRCHSRQPMLLLLDEVDAAMTPEDGRPLRQMVMQLLRCLPQAVVVMTSSSGLDVWRDGVLMRQVGEPLVQDLYDGCLVLIEHRLAKSQLHPCCYSYML